MSFKDRKKTSGKRIDSSVYNNAYKTESIKKQICELLDLQIDCNYNTFKNGIRYSYFRDTFADIVKDNVKAEILECETLLNLLKTNVETFSKWVEPIVIAKYKKQLVEHKQPKTENKTENKTK